MQSNLDEDDLQQVQTVANQAAEAAASGDWVRSTQLWVATELVIWQLTNYIDFYNILKYVNVDVSKFERGVGNVSAEVYEEKEREFLVKQLS